MSVLTRLLLVMGIFISVTTCGDMEDIEDEEIRTFVKRVRNILQKEFSTEGIEDIERIVVEELQDSTPSDDEESCQEVGRKSVHVAKLAPSILEAYLEGRVKDDLDPQSPVFKCGDNDEVTEDSVACAMAGCECTASNEKDSESGLYVAHCNRGVEETDYFYTERQVGSLDPPASDDEDTDTPPQPVEETAKYNFNPNNLGQKKVGDVFEVSIEAAAGEASPTTMNRDLYAYDANDTEVNGAMAVWKSSGNVYDDIHLAAGDSAEEFEVFMTKAAVGRVTYLGGMIGSDDLGMASISVVEPTCPACTMSANALNVPKLSLHLTILAFTSDPDPNSEGIKVLSVDSNGGVLLYHETTNSYKSDSHQWECDSDACTLTMQGESLTCEAGNPVFARIGDKVYQAECESLTTKN